MGNSTILLQNIVDSAKRSAELMPALATGNASNQPALDIATDVMIEMLAGLARAVDGRKIGPFAWKWNRFPLIPSPITGTVLAGIGGFGTFLTNSWQQDYAVPGLVLLSWIQSAHAININQTAQPKQVIILEVKRELDKNYVQASNYPGKICWLPNDQLDYGQWGQTAISSATGLTNPGPNVPYTVPLGAGVIAPNPITQIVDSNGNYWALTTYGTCGASQPSWPSPVTYPTFQIPVTTASTVTDGTCVWTALNPKGQGFRISPLPPQSGVVWLMRLVGQKRPPTFTTLRQTLEPIPDDDVKYFRDGFFAQCYRKNPDPKIRAKFDSEYHLWLLSLENAIRAGNSEQNDFGFVPDRSIMDGGYVSVPTPAWPWPGGQGGY